MASRRQTGPWRSGAETGLGIVLAITPVTFWIAWTPAVLGVAVAVAAISAALLVVLHERSSSAEGEQPAQAQPVLPEGFVDEVHRLFPLTYHHSLAESARFRASMQKLRRLLQ